MNEILKVERMCKTYSNFKLDNITIKIPKQSITGFIGINGAGKTTTLKSIIGLINYHSGSVLFNNKVISKKDKEFYDKVGFVLDGDYFYDNLTIKEMKNIVAAAYQNWDDKYYYNLIHQFNLPEKKKISDLSKGMKMKFALTLAMSHNPELLIMDEPTSGLDPKVRNDLLEILLIYVKEKKGSVLLSTHITSDLEKVANNLILINNGKIIFNDSLDIILNNHMIIEGTKDLFTNEQLGKFISYSINNNIITGLVKKEDLLQYKFNYSNTNIPNIEQLMLSYIEGGYNEKSILPY